MIVNYEIYNRMDKQQTQRTISRKEINKRKQRKLAQGLYDPYLGFDLKIQKQFQVDFIIQGERQKNNVTIKAMPSRQKDAIKLQLLSETDLFFYYEALISYSDLKQLNIHQGINVNQFNEFIHMLQKIFGEIEKGQKKMVFEVTDENKIKMVISKSINHKFFIVLTLQLTRLNDFQCNELAAYRYGCLRQQIADFQLRIKQVKDTIRSKNPYLLTFINKI